MVETRKVVRDEYEIVAERFEATSRSLTAVAIMLCELDQPSIRMINALERAGFLPSGASFDEVVEAGLASVMQKALATERTAKKMRGWLEDEPVTMDCAEQTGNLNAAEQDERDEAITHGIREEVAEALAVSSRKTLF